MSTKRENSTNLGQSGKVWEYMEEKMARYEDVTISGPDYEYTFEVYDLNTKFLSNPGVYIFSKGYPKATKAVS